MNKNGGYERLDNPVWYSLSETHKDISINYYNAKFYHPDIVLLEALLKVMTSHVK